jgi:hypothetical protein
MPRDRGSVRIALADGHWGNLCKTPTLHSRRWLCNIFSSTSLYPHSWFQQTHMHFPIDDWRMNGQCLKSPPKSIVLEQRKSFSQLKSQCVRIILAALVKRSAGLCSVPRMGCCGTIWRCTQPPKSKFVGLQRSQRRRCFRYITSMGTQVEKTKPNHLQTSDLPSKSSKSSKSIPLYHSTIP